MITDFRTLAPQDSLARAVDLLLAGAQQDFPVVDGTAVVGILTRADLLTALARHEQQSPVADVMRREFLVADASDMIDVVFERLQGHECRTIPILRRGSLIGLLTMDNVGEFLGIQTAIGGRQRTASAALSGPERALRSVPIEPSGAGPHTGRNPMVARPVPPRQEPPHD
jgi:CBS-domain-containing membrane protein